MRKIIVTVIMTGLVCLTLAACGSDGSRAGESQFEPAPATAYTTPEPSPELRFLQTIDGQGVPYTTREKAVQGGKTICQQLDAGTGWFVLAAALYVKWGPQGGAEKPLTQSQVGTVMRAAVVAFCPQHENLIP